MLSEHQPFHVAVECSIPPRQGHARLVGTRTSRHFIIGFAVVLLTYFGNYIFSGLYSYG